MLLRLPSDMHLAEPTVILAHHCWVEYAYAHNQSLGSTALRAFYSLYYQRPSRLQFPLPPSFVAVFLSVDVLYTLNGPSQPILDSTAGLQLCYALLWLL